MAVFIVFIPCVAQGRRESGLALTVLPDLIRDAAVTSFSNQVFFCNLMRNTAENKNSIYLLL